MDETIKTINPFSLKPGFLPETGDPPSFLAKSLETLELLCNAVPIPMVLARISDRMLLFSNPHALMQFGFCKSATPEIRLDDLFAAPGDADRLLQTLESKDIPDRFEVKMKRRDNSTFPALTSACIIDHQGESCVLLGLYDIRFQKQAEEALLSEKEKFISLTDHAPFGMVAIDRHGVFTYLNPKFRKLFGYDLEDIPNGREWFQKAYPDPAYRRHIKQIWKRDSQHAQEGQFTPEAFHVTCKDGTQKTIHFLSVHIAKRRGRA